MNEYTNLFLKRGARVFSRGRLIEILAGRFHIPKKDAKRLLNDLCNFGVFVKLPRKAPTYALCTPITPKNEGARATVRNEGASAQPLPLECLFNSELGGSPRFNLPVVLEVPQK